MTGSLCVVILTKNEEENLGSCLDGLPRELDVVVIDSGSTDRTVEIANRRKCEVIHRPWLGFADQRNFALSKLSYKYDWVLFVDADELFSEAFFKWARKYVANPNADVVYVSQRLVLNGRVLQYAPHYPIYHPRLVSTKRGVFVKNASNHGETVDNDVTVHHVDIPYLHYFVGSDIDRWLSKHVGLARAESEPSPLLGRQTARARLGAMLGAGPTRAVVRFLFHFVWCRGFLDGRAGFQYSLMYFWYEITKWIFISHRRAGGADST